MGLYFVSSDELPFDLTLDARDLRDATEQVAKDLFWERGTLILGHEASGISHVVVLPLTRSIQVTSDDPKSGKFAIDFGSNDRDAWSKINAFGSAFGSRSDLNDSDPA